MMSVADSIRQNFWENAQANLAKKGVNYALTVTPDPNRTARMIGKDNMMKASARANSVATGSKKPSKYSGSGNLYKPNKRTTKKKKDDRKVGENVDQFKVTKELSSQAEKKGFWDNALETVSRPLDVISRPYYAANEAVRYAAQNLSEGEPLWSTFDDFIYGAGQGFGGFQKSGFGDMMDEVYYNAALNDPSRLNDDYVLPTENVRDENGYLLPEVRQQMWNHMDAGNRGFRRVMGGSIEGDKGIQKYLAFGIGDIAGDPMSRVSFGAVTGLKKGLEAGAEAGIKAGVKEGVKAGFQKGAEGFTEAGVKAAYKGAKKGAKAAASTFVRGGSERVVGEAIGDAVKSSVVKGVNEFFNEAEISASGKYLERELTPDMVRGLGDVSTEAAAKAEKIAAEEAATEAAHAAKAADLPQFNYTDKTRKKAEAELAAGEARTPSAKNLKAVKEAEKALNDETNLKRMQNALNRSNVYEDAIDAFPDWMKVTNAAKNLAKKMATSGQKVAVEDIEDTIVAAAKEVTERGTKAIEDILGRPIEKTLPEVIDDAVDKFAKGQIAGGPLRGRTLYSHKSLPNIIASSTAGHYYQKWIRELDEQMSKIVTLDPSRLGSRAINDNKYLRHFRDTYLEMVAKDAKNLSVEEIGHNARKATIDLMNRDADLLYNKVLTKIAPISFRSPTFRVWNGKEVTLRRTGDVLDWVGKRMDDSAWVEGVRKAFSYKHNFPGYTGIIGREVRSMDMEAYEYFSQEVNKVARQYSRGDRKALGKILREGGELPEELKAARNFIHQMYDDMLDTEVAFGLRPADQLHGANYNYMYLHGGTANRRRAFVQLREEEILAHGKPVTATFEEAKKRGLRPEPDPFVNLKAARAEHQRKMIQKWYAKQVVTEYGRIFTDFAADKATRLANLRNGLVPVEPRFLTPDLQEALRKGEQFYLPREIYNTLETFSRMNSGVAFDNELSQFFRIVDSFNGKFKTAATVLFPSYHFNNMIGDAMMGALDGVTPADYARVLRIIQRDSDSIIMKIGDKNITRAEFDAAYDTMASAGGFYNTEIPGSGFRPMDKLKEVAEARENWGRRAHFYHALKEELAASYRKFKGDFDKAWKVAIDNATYRVDFYKLDYRALTPWELKWMKRLIPFYTFQRKIAPVLAQSLLLSPAKMLFAAKALDIKNMEDNPQGLSIPSWMRETGFTQITGGKEPTMLMHGTLPTGVFSMLNPGYNGQPAASNIATNILSQITPLAQVPIEIANQKTLFTGKPLGEGNLPLPVDAILSHFRPYTAAQQAAKLNSDDIGGFIKFFTGVPTYKLSEGLQRSAFKEQEDIMEKRINDFNKKLEPKGYSVKYRKRKDKKTGEYLMEYRIYKYDPNTRERTLLVSGFNSFEDAAKRAAQLAGG